MAEGPRHYTFRGDPDPNKLRRIVRRFNVVSVIIIVYETKQRAGGLANAYGLEKLEIPPELLLGKGQVGKIVHR